MHTFKGNFHHETISFAVNAVNTLSSLNPKFPAVHLARASVESARLAAYIFSSPEATVDGNYYQSRPLPRILKLYSLTSSILPNLGEWICVT